MIKHFCDECKKELRAEEVGFSAEMIGTGEFCFEHAPAHVKDDMIYSFPSRTWNKEKEETK